MPENKQLGIRLNWILLRCLSHESSRPLKAKEWIPFDAKRYRNDLSLPEKNVKLKVIIFIQLDNYFFMIEILQIIYWAYIGLFCDCQIIRQVGRVHFIEISWKFWVKPGYKCMFHPIHEKLGTKHVKAIWCKRPKTICW